MSNPHIPNPSPTPPGGAGWSTPVPGQFAGAAQGVPYQGGGQPMPAPQAWGAPGPYPMARPARPQLSTRVRVCLRIELVMWVIALVNVFTPYFFDDLRLYLLRFTDIWFYQWFFIYAVLIALSAIALVGRNAVVRYVLVGVVLVFFLLINPVLSVAQGGQWYALFTPPTLDPSVYGDDWSASLLLVRSLVIWLIVRTGIVTAIVLAVPDRRTPCGCARRWPLRGCPHAGWIPGTRWCGAAPRREPRCPSGYVARARAGRHARARAGCHARCWRRACAGDPAAGRRCGQP